MNNVTLHIGGRDYAVACAEGEEAHIAALGRVIDGKLGGMDHGHSETRTLLFAALMLADELHELRSGAPDAPAHPAPDAPALDGIAARLEALASRFEQHG